MPTFRFIGVSTAGSSIMRVFPEWMRALGRSEVAIEGIDLRIHDEAARYRQVVRRIRDDPLVLGALVTTHKIDLMEAAGDLFDRLGPYAQTCGEVSCISKRDGTLWGTALDPTASGLSLDAVIGADYFQRTGGEVLCFGAGGAATAISLHLIGRPSRGDRPRRFVVVNRSPQRLDRLRAMVGNLGPDITFEYVHNSELRHNDTLMAALPGGSLVINATGMGKDRPGSPITDAGRFPVGGIAWELNYRGERLFMHQALSQVEERGVTVEDGWRYFLHGWTQAIMQVLRIEIDEPTFGRLAEIAASVR